MAKAPSLPTITGSYASSTQLNAAFRAIEDAFDNTLSRDGSTPNQMDADIDLNSNDLLNVGLVSAESLFLDGVDITGLAATVNSAADRAVDAADRAAAISIGIFDTRAAYAAWVALGNTAVAGRTYWVGGLPFQGQIGATVTGLTGLVPHPQMTVTSYHFGENTTPGTTDMLAAINAGLAWVAVRGKVLVLPPDDHYHSAGITFPAARGLQMVSEANFRSETSLVPTRLLCDSTTGPQVKITNWAQRLDACVRATGARASAAYSDSTPGVRLEYYEDVPGSSIAGAILNVSIQEQPGDALQGSGGVYRCEFYLSAVNCKGRPFNLDIGVITGRTNLYPPIGNQFFQLRAFNCGGAMKIGNRAYGLSGLGIRNSIYDADVQYVSLDTPEADPFDVVADIHAENTIFENCAFGGMLGGVAAKSAVRMSGRHNIFISPRFVACISALVCDGNTVSVGCSDIKIEQPYFDSDCVMNPAVSIINAAGVGLISIEGDVVSGPGQMVPPAWFTAGYTRGIVIDGTGVDFNRNSLSAGEIVANNPAVARPLRAEADGAPVGIEVKRTGTGAVSGSIDATGGIIRTDWAGNVGGGVSVTIADDAVASIVPPKVGGFMLLTVNGDNAFPQANPSGLIWYSTGTTLAIEKSPSWGGSVQTFLNVTTSDVTGTTGTDARVTVAVQSGTIKIENRLGFSRTFQVTFL